nr:U32 family peptidase [Rhodospirillales bacterium]
MIGLTLGPLLFHWPRARRRDFYFRIADEAPVDCVHLGEVVCSKREPFAAPDIPEIAGRLQAAGKQVVLSTLALV